MTMTPKEQALVITMEECGELTQACSKILRHQNDPDKFHKWQKSLTEEAGDVLAMIDILVDKGFLNAGDIAERVAVKKNKLRVFSGIYQ